MSAFTYCVVNWLWRRRQLTLMMMPAQIAASFAALSFAGMYAVLSGFSLPALRAFLMLLVLMLSRFLRARINAWDVWAFALGIVLIVNPLCVLTPSFYLSFTTLALIIFGMDGRLSTNNFWWQWGRVQWIIAIGLLPLSFWLFQEASTLSIVANSIAIPWLEFFILPFCFIAIIFSFLSDALTQFSLFIAEKNLGLLWQFLTYLANTRMAVWHLTLAQPLILVSFIIGIFLCLLPKGFPGKYLSIVCFTFIIFYQPEHPKRKEMWLTLLDVGQGLGVVLQTKHHVLIYDTGPKLNANNDAGENIIVPFLRQQNINNIDMLVISHGDNDHIGGAQSLMQTFSIPEIKSSVPEKLTNRAEKCLENAAWNWDGVQFQFLYPSNQDFNLDNDSSCVLHVSNGKQSVLLTGDIEKYAEHKLLSKHAKDLSSTLLIAPHHGSKTSSQLDFIKMVQPQVVLYATGYRNRYHFPHVSVIKRYEMLGVKQYNTAQTGAISVRLTNENSAPILFFYRFNPRHYWYDQ